MGRVAIFSLLCLLLAVSGYILLVTSEKEASPRPSFAIRQAIVNSGRPTQSLSEEVLHASTESIETSDILSPQIPGESRATMRKDGEVSFRAAADLRAGEHADAVESFHERLAHDLSAFRALGLSYLNEGDYEDARFCLEKAREFNPGDFMVRKMLAFIYYKKDDTDKALANAEAALAVMDDPELQKLEARLKNEKSLEEHLISENSSHFKVSFDGYAHGDLSRKVIDILEDAYRIIGKEMDYFPAEPVSVVLYTNRDFYDITQSPEWSAGIFDGKIRIPMRGVDTRDGDLRKVLFHEYTHAVVHSLTPWCPLWINEGLAEYFSTYFGQRIGQLLPLSLLESSFSGLRPQDVHIAYWESYSAVSYLIERYGLYRFKKFLLALPKGTDFKKAFEDAFSVSYSEFTSSWGKS